MSANLPLIEIKNVTKKFGGIQVLDKINLSVFPGEFLTLLGPSGCGKTTLLRIISGFETPDIGEIWINQECVNHLPPQQRDVHTVFQTYALFPHLNVFENVAFALRLNKKPQKLIEEKVQEALSLVQLTGFEHRHTQQLSGGQQQRVAIARAIINRPKVLLLDEPLSSLDYRLRKAMQQELKQLQKRLNITFIFVTHDQEEALSMSDRIVIFNHGEIEQIGTPREVYETPTNLHVASFIGEANIFNVKVIDADPERLTIALDEYIIHAKNKGQYKKYDEVHLMIRPEDIRVWSLSEIEDTSDMLPGVITDITYKGSTVEVSEQLKSGMQINASEFFDEDDENLEYTIGENVWIHWLTGWEVLLPHEN